MTDQASPEWGSTLDWQTKLSDVEVPAWVTTLARGRPVEPVWRNEDHGTTFAIDGGRTYLKVQQPGRDWDPEAEVARLGWLRDYAPCPAVLDRGERSGLHWLLTSGLPGRSAVDRRWRHRPEVAVPALGAALRRFHDTVPASRCPFTWSVGDRVTRFALSRVFLDRVPPLDPVVCHGDACNPNFLLDDVGGLVGYVDLGSLGIADRWADLTPALMSLSWNYGPGWEQTFLEAYGVEPDDSKRTFYAALWDGVGDAMDRADQRDQGRAGVEFDRNLRTSTTRAGWGCRKPGELDQPGAG